MGWSGVRSAAHEAANVSGLLITIRKKMCVDMMRDYSFLGVGML